MKKLFHSLILFLTGGSIYILIETVWRLLRNSHPTHWSMFVLGGLMLLAVGGINEMLPWNLGMVWQSLIGAVIITVGEFTAGCIVNLWFGWDVWDYSAVPLNLLGQICLPFCIAWIALAAVAIALDDWLRYWLFKEERPHYTLF